MTTDALPDTFVQYKGTDLCMDLYCTCGECTHIDGMFMYRVQCESCQQWYELGTKVSLKKVDDGNWQDEL